MRDYSDVNAVFPLATFAIVGVDTVLETFAVAGDQTERILDGSTFVVIDSTGNDGTYTVASTSYAAGPDETTITVNENITNAVVDGKILQDAIADELTMTLSHDDAADRDATTPDQIAGAHIQRIDNEIRALGQTVGEGLGFPIIDAGGLIVHFGSGTVIFGTGTPSDGVPGKLTMTAASTNYVEVDSSAVVTSNTTSFTVGKYPLFIVTTAAGDITNIENKRSAIYIAESAETAHAMGGALHTPDTLVNLNTKVSDATLDDIGDSRPPSGVAGGELSGTYPDPTVDDGADATAIHDNVSAEIIAVAEKATPVNADVLLIEDSAASNVKKRVQIGNLPGGAHALGGAQHIADTLANLNTKVSDATLDDIGDSRPPSGVAGGDLGGNYPNPTVDDGADGSAIHDDIASEISVVTEKASPVSADLLLIEDSAAANVKKRVQIGNLPTGADADAIHDNVAAEISAITEKVSPVSADLIIIEDSAAANVKKKVQIGNLAGGGDMTKAVYDTGDDGIVDNSQGLRETGGPTTLAMAAVADGTFLKRSGATIIGSTPAGAGDMVKAVYDTGDNGIVDNSEALQETGGPTTLVMGVVADGRLLKRSGSSIVGEIPTRVIILKVIADDADLTTGDGKMRVTIPEIINGMNLTVVHAHVYTVSTSGLPTIQIHNETDTVDMLSTVITIDANEADSTTAATPPVIDGAADDVVTADVIRIDVDVAGTGTKGLEVRMQFETP